MSDIVIGKLGNMPCEKPDASLEVLLSTQFGRGRSGDEPLRDDAVSLTRDMSRMREMRCGTNLVSVDQRRSDPRKPSIPRSHS